MTLSCFIRRIYAALKQHWSSTGSLGRIRSSRHGLRPLWLSLRDCRFSQVANLHTSDTFRVTWPVVTFKQDQVSSHDASISICTNILQLAQAFKDREIRDGCVARLSYTINPTAGTITGVTVTTTGNTCPKPIPVTFPGLVTSTAGDTTEKLGSDPLTVWVKMTGSPRFFQLVTPIAL